MKRLYFYFVYLFLAGSLTLLGACSSSHKTAYTKTAPVKHVNRKAIIKAKYAKVLGVPVKDIDNYPLYAFINAWYGAPYKWAGRSRDGVDCSDFVSILYSQVYGYTLSGDCVNLLAQCKRVKESDLKEGDLVFFRIHSRHASHVGVYLMNHKFVHASVHAGVVISNLDMAYYQKYFYRAGRLKHSLTQSTYKG